MKKKEQKGFVHGRRMLRKTFMPFLALVFWLLSSFNPSLAQNAESKDNVTLNLKNVSLEEVIWEIQKQTDLVFIYGKKDIEHLKNLNVKAKEKNAIELLFELLENTDITVQEVDGTYVFKKKKTAKGNNGPKVEITGKVVDKDGEPLPGATILEKGTLNGVITSPDGTYNITVSGVNSILRISYVGFETQEIIVGTQTTIDVILQISANSLDEVVVIGYGTAKKESIGSAISQIKGEYIEEQSVGLTSFEQILGGQIKGVHITQTSGEPGASAVIHVRGITSPFGGSSNQPLYVIDGVPFNTDAQFEVGGYAGNSQNLLLSVNPNDIESFTVLKDAAATAIYGSRGANGVILITTKRGQKNKKIHATIDYSLSMNNPIRKLDMLDAEGFKELHTMIARSTINAYALGNSSSSGYSSAIQIINPETGEVWDSLLDLNTGEEYPVFGDANTNWQDEVYRKNAATHQWNVNVSGGDEHTNFCLGLTYTKQQPLVKNSNYKKYGARLSIDSEVKKWLKIGSSLNYNGGWYRNPSATSDANDILLMRPDYGVFDENGGFLRYPNPGTLVEPGVTRINSFGANPVAALENENITYSTAFIGNAYTEVKMFEGFKLRADVNAGVFKTRGRNFKPLRAQALSSNLKSYLFNSIAENYNTSLSFQANYHKVIDKHDFEVMAGTSWDKSTYYRIYNAYSDLQDDYVLTNAPSAVTLTGSGDGRASSGINSFYSRIQYSYDRKYTATLNFRTDKSSKFGPGNKVATFPSIALNWNIDREKFMENIKQIDQLILRVSYGKSGSANVADFTYLQYFESGAAKDKEYEPGNTSIIPNSIYPNSDIHWESTKEFNTGVDFSLFSNRLYAGLEVYFKNTDGVLIASPYALESGASSYTSNLAEISNKGWEFEIGGDIIRNKDFRWSVSFNIAANRNKVESMEGSSLSSYQSDYYTVGYPVGIIKGYRVEKIIQEQSEIDALNEASSTGVYYSQYTGPGDYLYKDLTGDNRVTSDDQEIIGTTQPDYFGGFNTMFSYKGFSLSASFQYSIGNESLWENYLLVNIHVLGKNGLSEALTETWTPENTSATYPRLDYGYANNKNPSDATLQDASFLRLKMLRLNYDLPEKLLSKLDIKNAMIYVSASNLFTWTSFKGVDPERGNATMSSDALFPYSKTVSFGIKVGL